MHTHTTPPPTHTHTHKHTHTAHILRGGVGGDPVHCLGERVDLLAQPVQILADLVAEEAPPQHLGVALPVRQRVVKQNLCAYESVSAYVCDCVSVGGCGCGWVFPCQQAQGANREAEAAIFAPARAAVLPPHPPSPPTPPPPPPALVCTSVPALSVLSETRNTYGQPSYSTSTNLAFC
jgi:hypothetical protein